MSAPTQHDIEQTVHLETFFEHASMGIIITDRNGFIRAANPYALKEFGYDQQELFGKKIELLIPSRFHNKHNKYHGNYIDKPVSRPMGEGMELFARKKDGTEINVEISLNNYQLNSEKYVIAFINNVTLRKKAEAKIVKLNEELETTVKSRTGELVKALKELKKTKSTLEKAISFQKATLDNAGAMIIATDITGTIKLFNAEASLNLGYEPTELIDKKTPVFFHDKKEIARKRNLLQQELGITVKSDFDVLVEKARRNFHEEEQYTYVRKDGRSFPVLLTVSSIKNNKGEITGFFGIAIDITERRKAEKILLKSLEKEKELGELKSRFVSMASHEFRTPLSTILSSAYLIEKYSLGKQQPHRVKHLQRIISSVSMLTDILNDFLSIGKIEEGKIPVRFSTFDIPHFIKEVVKEMKATFQKGQILRYVHKGTAMVVMDKSLLKHIIFNLVSNASKFSPQKSYIEIKTENQNGHLLLSVQDQGIGISPNDQKHLMERFFRGANAGNIQGTGLGLHIVSKYAELMNGTVVCNSELEKGTGFVITFQTKNNSHEKDTVN
jgi:PAS domain S-box-containing protein